MKNLTTQTPSLIAIPTHPLFQNLTNKTFSRLTVLRIYQRTLNGKYQWLCQCQCGNICTPTTDNLRSATAKSCGCLRAEMVSTRRLLHNESNSDTPEYRAYCHARNRCNNSTNKSFPHYGGRGIEFRFNSYTEFLEHLGRRPTSKHSLDRIDVNGHYERGNVRWADDYEQMRNRQNTHTVTLSGETKSVAEWCEIYHMPYHTVRQRLNIYKWCESCALTLPSDKNRQRCPHKVLLSSF